MALNDSNLARIRLSSVGSAVMSAAKFPSPGGLTLDEVRTLVEAVIHTGKLKVFNLAGYNSMLDRDRASGRTIIDLVSGLWL